MSSHDAFIKEITANPEDLTPRLIYADWLDEQGDPRGEFIRIQCELATIDETEDRYGDLLLRERELLAEHRQEWMKPLKPYVRNGTFRCGFVERARVRLSTFLSNGEQIARLTPLRTIVLTSASQHLLLPLIPNSLVLKQLAGLEFHSFQGINNFFPTLARFPELPKLRRLVISKKGSFNLKKIRQLLQSDMCAHLKSLVLPDNDLKPYCLEEITRSDLRLKQLDLSGNRRLGESIDHLVNWSKLSELESLNLNGCNLVASSLRGLLRSPGLGKLRHLAVQGIHFASREGLLELIAHTPAMSQLTTLDIAGHPADADDIIALTNSPHLHALRRLDLSLGNDQDASLILLSQWPGLGKLHHLRLTQCYGYFGFYKADLERIVHSPHWSQNAVLSITPRNAQLIRQTEAKEAQGEKLRFELSEVRMGYLHDPIGVF